MDVHIEPSAFDAVVVSSGLPEVLIASALARAGKSVLLLDPSDFYGAAWASLPGPAFLDLLFSKKTQQQQQQQPEEHKAPSELLPDVCRLVPLSTPEPWAAFWGAKLYAAGEGAAAAFCRRCIVDLAPKAMYQAEDLVEVLVGSRTSKYLDLKLIEGSFMLRPPGRLVPMPAGKADIFTDREMGPAAKRSLMKFLRGCLEAEEGAGPLKDAFDSRPLVDLLASEGLDQQLTDVVVYGIAACDQQQPQPHPRLSAQTQRQPGDDEQGKEQQPSERPQHQQQQQLEEEHEGACDGSGTQSLESGSGGDGGDGGNTSGAPPLSAAQGLSAMRLFTESVGRYGGRGAFMSPCYGSGALLEAFVRLAAVKGAVSVLRMGLSGLVVGAEGADVSADAGTGVSTSALVGGRGDGEGSGGGGGAGNGTGAAAEAAAVGREFYKGVVLSSGQVVRSGCLVGGPELAAACSSAGWSYSGGRGGGGGAEVQVARAAIVTDSPLCGGEGSLLFVAPPPGPSTGGGLPHAVVRGLQVGPAMQVVPPGRQLVYVSAAVPARAGAPQQQQADAEQLLRPVVDSLLRTDDLRLVSAGGDSGGCAGGEAGVASGDLHDGRPKALAVAYYMQRLTQPHSAAAAAAASRAAMALGASGSGCAAGTGDGGEPPFGGGNVICCRGPDGGLVGYREAVAAAEKLFRSHFPDLPWHTDPPPVPALRRGTLSAAAGDSEEGADGEAGDGREAAGPSQGTSDGGAASATGAGEGDNDEEDAAIDELQAALLELGMTIPASGGPPAGS